MKSGSEDFSRGSKLPEDQEAFDVTPGEIFVGNNQEQTVTYNINSVTGGVVAHTVNLLPVQKKTPEEIISHLKKLSTRIKSFECYVPLDGSSVPLSVDKEKQKEQRKPLHHSHVIPFLVDQSRSFLLLLGESGAGKSTYVKKLVEECWNDFTSKKVINRIPIFLECNSLLDKNLNKHSLTQEIMRIYGLTEAEVFALKEMPVLLILDGYDEKKVEDVNIFDLFKLDEWNAKIVVSCRTQYVQENRQYRLFFPKSINNTGSELYLCPFSPSQVDECIRKYTKSNILLSTDRWSVSRYDYPELYELIENPLLLSMVIEALPNLLKNQQEIKKRFEMKHDRVKYLPKFTRTDIYRAFIESWHERAARRLFGITGQSEVKLWDYPAKFLTQEAFGIFCENLSLSMYLASQGMESALLEVEYKLPSVVTSRRRKVQNENHAWEKFFTTEDDVIRDIRQGCPLRYVDTKYSFYHKSFLEYYMALSLFNELLDEESLEESDQDFLSRLSDHAINKKLMVKDRAVLDFFAEMIQGNSRRIERLLKVIFASRKSVLGDAVAIAAANAITVLDVSYFNFSKIQFCGVNISCADLRGAFCDETNFEGSNLTGVNFSYAWLHRAIFSKCIMKNSNFGQNSWFFASEYWFKCFAYCENRYFAWLDEKNIHIYDATTKQLLFSFFIGKVADSVECIKFNSTGTRLLYTENSLVHILDIVSGEEYAVLYGHTDDVKAAVFSSDDTKIASVSDDMSLRIWDVENKCELAVFDECDEALLCCAFSPNGLYVASGGKDSLIRIWDIFSQEIIGTLIGHRSEITCLKFSADNKRLVSGSNDETLRIWNVEQRIEEKVLVGHCSEISDVCFSQNSELVVSSGLDNTVRVWEVESGKELTTLYGRESQTSVHISQDGRRVISSEPRNNVVNCWEELMSRVRAHVETQINNLYKIAFMPNGQQFVSADYDGFVKLWDVKKKNVIAEFKGHRGLVRSLAVCENGACLASGGSDGSIRIYDLLTNKEIGVLQGHTQAVNCLQFNSDGNFLISGSDDTTLRFWDIKKMVMLSLFKGHEKGVTCITFGPGEKQIISGSEDQSVRFWDIKEGRMIGLYNHGGGTPTSLYFSKKHSLVLTNRWVLDLNNDSSKSFHKDGFDGKAILYGTFKKEWDNLFHESPRFGRLYNNDHPLDAEHVMFSVDGEHVLLVAKNKIIVWEISTEKIINEMPLNFHKKISTFSYSHNLLILILKDGGLQYWRHTGIYDWFLDWSSDIVNESLYVEELVTEQIQELSVSNQQLLYQGRAKIEMPTKQLSIDDVPGLREHVKNPELIRIAIKAVPELIKRSGISCDKLSKSIIYDEIIRKHFLKIESQFGLVSLTSESDAFESEFWRFAKLLAIFMYQKKLVDIWNDPGLSNLTDLGSPKLFAFFQSGLFQEIEPNHYKFLDDSLLKYFLSRDIFDAITKKCLTDNDHYFNKYFLVDEEEVLSFLADRVFVSNSFRSNLLGCLYSSKNNPATAISSSNAITVLVKAGVKFSEASLTHLNFPHANISLGNFIGADLSNSVMSYAKMFNVLLAEANIDGCKMDGVRFFESLQFEHDNPVLCFDYREDLNRLVTATQAQCFIWDTQTGDCILALTGHEADVSCVRYSPDGRYIVSGSVDLTLRIWDSSGGKELGIFRGHEAPITCVQYSPNGFSLVSGSEDKSVRIWDVRSTKEILSWKEFDGKIESVDFSSDGKEVVITDENIWICNLSSGELKTIYMQNVKTERYETYKTTFKLRASGLASGKNEKIIQMWNSLSEDVLIQMSSLPGRLASIFFSPNGQYVVTECLDKSIQCWNADEAKGIAQIEKEEVAINHFQVLPDGKRLVLASKNTVSIKEINSNSLKPVLRKNKFKISKIVFSFDSKKVAVASFSGEIKIYDAQNGAEIAMRHEHEKEVDKMMFSADGKHLVSACSDNLCLWDMTATSGISLLKKSNLSVSCLSISANSNYLAYCELGWAETFIVLDLNNQQVVAKKKKSPQDDIVFWFPMNAVFSPDEKTILMDVDCILKWNFRSDKLPQKLLNLEGKEISFEFSRDGSKVLCSEYNLLWIVDLDDHTKSTTFPGDFGNIKKALFCNEEKWVISGADDRAIRVWDVKSGDCLSVLDLDHDVTHFELSHKGHVILSHDDNTLTCWEYMAGVSENKWRVRWTQNPRLKMIGLSAQNVVGLSRQNCRLLKQHGANVTCNENIPMVDSKKETQHQGYEIEVESIEPNTLECHYNVEAIAYAHRGIVLASHWEPGVDEPCNQALIEFDTAIFLDSTSSWLFRERADCKVKLFRKREAVDDYSEAIRLNPADCESYLARGDCWFDLKEFDKAFADYDELVRINPYYKDATKHRANKKSLREHYQRMSNKYFNSGQDKSDKGYYEGALEDFDESFRYYPNPDVLRVRGRIKAELGRYSDAIVDYAEAIQLNPDCSRAYRNWGVAMLFLGQLDKAMENFNTVLSSNNLTEDPVLMLMTLSNKAFVYFLQGLAEESADMITCAQICAESIEDKTDPSFILGINICTLVALFLEYCPEKDTEIILERFMPLFKEDQKFLYVELITYIGLAFFHMGNYQKAYLCWHDILGITPEKGSALETQLHQVSQVYLHYNSFVQGAKEFPRFFPEAASPKLTKLDAVDEEQERIRSNYQSSMDQKKSVLEDDDELNQYLLESGDVEDSVEDDANSDSYGNGF